MYVYKIASTNPLENLAIEEVCFKYWDQSDPLLLLWQNDDTIVIGKHQNPHEEVNMSFVNAHQIPVLRRMSGGGTVYHDRGNVNYSLIYGNSKNVILNVHEISEILIKGLETLGLSIELSPRHDLRIGGKKISGTAQARSGAQILHHGTLLFNSDIGKLKKALKVSHKKLASKSVPSVPSSVINISEVMDEVMDVHTFIDKLVEAIGKSHVIKEWTLPTCLKPEVISLIDQKYSQWDWNYGRSKFYSFQTEKVLPWGRIEIEVEENKGLIERIQLRCPAIEDKELRQLEASLLGQVYDEDLVFTDLLTEYRAGLPKICCTYKV